MALLLLAGCERRAPECASGHTQSRTPLFELGVAYTGFVAAGTFVHCPGSEHGFRAELFDENNQPVAGAEWTLADAGLAALRFTPQSAGPYYYRVVFDPGVAVVQGLLTRGVRRSRPVLQTIPLPAGQECARGFVNPRGSLLCHGATLRRIRPGEPTVTLPYPGQIPPVVWAGDVVWVNGLNLERWVDTDAGFVRVPEGTTSRWSPLLAATETEAFAGNFDSVTRYAVDGGAWLDTEVFSAPNDLSPQLNDIAPFQATSMGTDGGWWWWTGRSFWCRSPVRSGGERRCFPAAAGRVDTLEPQRIWWLETASAGYMDETGRVVRAPSTGSALSSAPVLRDGDRVALLALEPDGGLHYEIIDGDYTSGWVQGDRLYLVSAGAVTVLPR